MTLVDVRLIELPAAEHVLVTASGADDSGGKLRKRGLAPAAPACGGEQE
jgi:hypothetical protein